MENKFKPCIICEKNKPINDFHKNLNKDKRFNVCKECHYQRYNDWRKKPENKEKIIKYRRNHVFKRRYGINIEQYDQMVIKQNNLCLICEKQPDNYGPPQVKRLSIDHCHITGTIRGLLCHRCNTALGAFHEDINIINKAIVYLKKHK